MAGTLIGLICQEGRQGVAQVVVVRGVLALALHVLIVDRAAVADSRESVEHDHLAGALDQGRVGDQVLGVFQDGKLDASFGDVLGDVFHRSRGRWS